jgi:uncharacterized protein
VHRAETRIATPNASKYLQQLCRHWRHKFDVSFTPHSGRVPFGADRACVMEADSEFLTLRVEAPDAATSARLGAVVAEHLQRFAHRENVTEAQWREV